MLIPISSIEIPERIREARGKDFEQFKQSFPKFGQLQPIRVIRKVNGMYMLNAGFRRLTAITELHAAGVKIPRLPDGMIEAAEPDEHTVPTHTRLLQEFAENNDREDFNFLEKAKFIRRFHETMQTAYGEDAWSQEATAHSLNLSAASISHYLRVEEAAKSDSSIAKAATLDAAVKRMKVNEKIKTRIEEARKDDPTNIERANAILALADAREWIKAIPDASVDLVNFDPPWGDDTSHKSAENHESFDDSTEYSDSLMRSLFPEIFRILKPDRFCIFWFRVWASEQMAALVSEYGFNLKHTRTPVIWYKPDKITDQNRFPEKQLIEAYEPFYILRKGDPVFHERYVHNVFSFERVSLGNLVHPTEKPLALCEALLKLLSVPGELVVDPTAGSSAILDAAIRNNRKAQGCELSPKYHERGIARLADYLKTFSVK